MRNAEHPATSAGGPVPSLQQHRQHLFTVPKCQQGELAAEILQPSQHPLQERNDLVREHGGANIITSCPDLWEIDVTSIREQHAAPLYHQGRVVVQSDVYLRRVVAEAVPDSFRSHIRVSRHVLVHDPYLARILGRDAGEGCLDPGRRGTRDLLEI